MMVAAHRVEVAAAVDGLDNIDLLDDGRNPKWRARYEQIVDTSAEVIAQRGYHATGINELCAANELGKGALYHYIGSKEDLLVAINDRVLDAVIEGAERVTAAGGTATEQLRRLGDELIDVISRYPHHVWVTLHDFLALTGDRAAHFRGRRREYERYVERLLEAGIRSGEFREVDVRVTTLAWIGMYNYTYRWLSTDGSHTPREVAATFSEIFLRGLAA